MFTFMGSADGETCSTIASSGRRRPLQWCFEIYREMLDKTGDSAYLGGRRLILASLVYRVADYNSSICRRAISRESLSNTFSRQALGMVWDYAETDPFAGGSGSLDT